MVKLSGVLDYSMGGFLCLRGYALFKQLCSVSEANQDVQRDLIEQHKGEMAAFLNTGEYRFFPEVVLSLNLLSGNNHADIEYFYESIRSKGSWNQKLGNYRISVSNNETKDPDNGAIQRVVQIAHITFDEAQVKLRRIDGNHRLSAADSVSSSFLAPFCIILFRNPTEEDQFARAIFHNINAKQIPLKLEENLKVILESTHVFSDEKLKSDPSFGWPYYLARKTAEKHNFDEYPFIHALIRGSKYTYLLEEYALLLKNGTILKTDDSIDQFCRQLPKIEAALQEAQLQSVPQNLAVIGALSYYKLTDQHKYQQFLKWVQANSITQVPDIHMHDLIQIFDKVYENIPKSVFMSMQFSADTEDTYQTVKDVRDILKRENGIEFKLIKVDEHEDGYSDEIYHRIIEGIKESALVIADLSYGNKNVHHEIGYAQGLNKKVLMLYKTRPGVEPKTEIGSNISMHDQLRYTNQTELRPKLLKKIRQFFGISNDEN